MLPINTSLTKCSYFNTWWKSWKSSRSRTSPHWEKPNTLPYQTYHNGLYKIQMIIKYKKPTSESYFEIFLENSNLDWKTIYLLPHIAQVDATIPVLSANYLLFCFKIKCFLNLEFCKIRYTPLVIYKKKLHYIYSATAIIQILWERHYIYIQNTSEVSSLTEWLSIWKLHYCKSINFDF